MAMAWVQDNIGIKNYVDTFDSKTLPDRAGYYVQYLDPNIRTEIVGTKVTAVIVPGWMSTSTTYTKTPMATWQVLESTANLVLSSALDRVSRDVDSIIADYKVAEAERSATLAEYSRQIANLEERLLEGTENSIQLANSRDEIRRLKEERKIANEQLAESDRNLCVVKEQLLVSKEALESLGSRLGDISTHMISLRGKNSELELELAAERASTVALRQLVELANNTSEELETRIGHQDGVISDRESELTRVKDALLIAQINTHNLTVQLTNANQLAADIYAQLATSNEALANSLKRVEELEGAINPKLMTAKPKSDSTQWTSRRNASNQPSAATSYGEVIAELKSRLSAKGLPPSEDRETRGRGEWRWDFHGANATSFECTSGQRSGEARGQGEKSQNRHRANSETPTERIEVTEQMRLPPPPPPPKGPCDPWSVPAMVDTWRSVYREEDDVAPLICDKSLNELLDNLEEQW